MNHFTHLIVIAFLTTVTYSSIIKQPGFELEARIVGGNDTTIKRFPYIVSVRIYDSHICGGSIISKRVVVTAGHCIHSNDPINSYSIQYGVSVIGGKNNSIAAKRVLKHEHYDSTNFKNDIALIFLKCDIPFSACAQPIQLATKVPVDGVSAIVSGWGILKENGKSAPILQQVSVQIISRTTCQKQYKDVGAIIEESMLCAGVNGGGKDHCYADSGGPLVSNNTLAGIVSFAVGCARADYFGVYSSVAAFKKWVDLNMAE